MNIQVKKLKDPIIELIITREWIFTVEGEQETVAGEVVVEINDSIELVEGANEFHLGKVIMILPSAGRECSMVSLTVTLVVTPAI